MPKWPTGCECVSAVMLLNYLKIPISVDDFIQYMPKRNLMVVDGISYGESPDEFFIGSPYDRKSFGCYAGVIVNTINTYAKKNNLDIRAVNISSLSTGDMIQKYIINGIPIIYWATIDLVPSKPGPSWMLVGRNDCFTWKSNEHCMLLVGVEREYYVFNDPWNNNGIIKYPKALVEQRHNEMYSMAVAIDYSMDR